MTITPTNLGSQHHGGDGPYTSSATLTPGGNNRLLCLAVAGGTASATQPATPSISGLNVTWVQEDTVDFDTLGSTDRAGIFLFRAMGSPSSGTITITFSGQVLNRCDWSLDEFNGVDTSGTNGSGAIVQSVANAIAANTTHTITLAAFADATNNAAYGCFAHQASEAYTQGSGFNLLGNPFGTGGNFSLLSEWKLGQDTGVDCSWASSRVSGGVAVEIKAAVAGTASPLDRTGPTVVDTGSTGPTATPLARTGPTAQGG